MDAVITSFERYELKYFLTEEQKSRLMPVLLERMAVDEYGEHTISNIFFDTDTYEITRASIEKPIYKEKLRVRAYGTPDPETGMVFIELKKKYNKVVYKRRIAVPVPAARAFLLEGKQPESADPQITREIARFMELHHPRPKVFLCYDRMAMFSRENPDLRITMDTNLLWRDRDLSLCSGAWGDPVLPENRTLMEIKIPGVMPLWLSHTLSELRIFRTSFSKIGTCFKTFIIPEIFSKKEVNAPCLTPSSPVVLHPSPSSSVPAPL